MKPPIAMDPAALHAAASVPTVLTTNAITRAESARTAMELPTHLAEIVSKLVAQAVDQAATGGCQIEAVDGLVTASRWNPALLMVAVEQASELAGDRPDDKFTAAVENLQAAEERVRQRAY